LNLCLQLTTTLELFIIIIQNLSPSSSWLYSITIVKISSKRELSML